MNARLLILLVAALALTPGAASWAATKKVKKKDAQGYDLVFMPTMKDNIITIDVDTTPPNEPNLVQVTFLQDAPPRGLLDRVNRLSHGISVDIPPEYDQYGYEIRRYMASVGNIKIYTDEEFLEEQIRNTRKARVIVRFWQQHLEKELDELEQLISEEDSASSIWTALKQNRQLTRSFVIDLQGWVDANERLLLKIFDLFGYIQLQYPELIFMRPHERIQFFNLYQIRQAKLNAIKKYQAFALMAY